MTSRRVVISGMGTVTPFGIGTSQYWDGISRGISASTPITRFDTSLLPTQFAAQLALTNEELEPYIDTPKILKTLSRSGRFVMIAAAEAISESGFKYDRGDPYRFGTSIGAPGIGLFDLDYTNETIDIVANQVAYDRTVTIDRASIWKNYLERIHPLTPMKGLPNIPTSQIAIRYNARGNCLTVTTACTSSTQAIGESFRQIKEGVVDVVLTGGSDSMVNPKGLVSFSALGVLSRNNAEYRTAARPFDRRRDGFIIGEGSSVFLVEELGHCLGHGRKPEAEIIGYASTCDAFRLTDEPPDARGSIVAMDSALESAGIRADEVNYINAHGTGTLMNDRTETLAIKTVFGDAARMIPVSSTKSMIGHLVAAAGAVELAACVLALRHQVIPPTINYEEPDPDCDLDYVPNRAREANLNVILSNSFGFGGQNACLILRKYS